MKWLTFLLAICIAACAQDRGAYSCLTCHPAPGLLGRLREGTRPTPEDEAAHFFGSAHAEFTCQTCHPGTTPGPHKRKPETLRCEACHQLRLPGKPQSGAVLVDQLHTRRSRHAPSCTGCHGAHGVSSRDDPAGNLSWQRVADLCDSCHANPTLARVVPQVQYPVSIHSQVVHQVGGKRRAVVCTDCHTVHAHSKTEGLSIPARRGAMPQTCGRCHHRQAREFLVSVHGTALARGVQNVPVCTDCHTEHAIRPPTDPESSVSPQGVVRTCGGCHGNAELVRLSKLPTHTVLSYKASYHGKANKYGDVRVANCASCHTAHSVLPASDPRSSVHPQNLPKTCGQCHPGAGTTFRIGRMHVMPTPRQDRLLFLLRSAYQLFVAVTVLGFLGYIALDLATFRRLKAAGIEKELEQRLAMLPPPPRSALVRMVRAERLQHMGLLVCFTLLAVTGFALLLPDSLFAQVVVYMCGGMGGRALVHRVAAAGLIGLAIVHIVWVLVSPRGRETFTRILPRLSDLRDAWLTARLFLGLSLERPCFYRYSYLEKFEYWALVWGTCIMSLTGLLLVYMDWSLAFLPKWVLDAADIVHTWEAVLAVVSIAIWHLYHVLWKPGVFPGNRSWLQGDMTLEEYIREHPLDYAEAMGWLPPPGGERKKAAPPQE